MTYLEFLQSKGLNPVVATEDGEERFDSLTDEEQRILLLARLEYFRPEIYAALIEKQTVESDAVNGFRNLPEWSIWTSQDAKDNVHARIFNGWTQVQVDNYIDTTATNAAGIAGVRTVLKQVGAAIIAIRTILEAMAQAIVFLRDLVVRFWM